MGDIANSVIVLQPGSQQLLLGRATDVVPTAVPHVLAYRRGAHCAAQPASAPAVPPAPSEPEHAELLGATAAVLRELSPVALVGAEHAIPPPAIAADAGRGSPTDEPPPSARVLCGEAARRLPADAPYDLLFPLRRGRFNYAGSAGVGANGAPGRSFSPRELSDSLRLLWSHALLEVLELSASELGAMGVLLLLPDSFERREVKEMLDVLAEIGFGALSVHVRSVCAALGAGLPAACVVEVEADTVEVAAVDDGVCVPRARACLPFGGRDVEAYLLWLLGAEARGELSAHDAWLDAFLPSPPAAAPADEPQGGAARAGTAAGAPAGAANAPTPTLGAESLGGPRRSELGGLQLDPRDARHMQLLSWVRASRCTLRARSEAELASARFVPTPAGAAAAAGASKRSEGEAASGGECELSALATHAPPLVLLDARLRAPLQRAEHRALRACALQPLPGDTTGGAPGALPSAAAAASAKARASAARELPPPWMHASVDHSDYLDDLIATEIAADTRSHHAKPKQQQQQQQQPRESGGGGAAKGAAAAARESPPEGPREKPGAPESSRKRDSPDVPDGAMEVDEGGAAAEHAASAPPPPTAAARRAFDEDTLSALTGRACDTQAMGIDEAVVRVVGAHGRPELRQKLYGCVLLSGSCSATPGLASRLRALIAARLAGAPARASGAGPEPAVAVEVLHAPEACKADGASLAWRGGALVASSEVMNELWVQRSEWINGGARVLRERIPFQW